MNTFAVDVIPLAASVHCSDEELIVSLKDGRSVSVPLAWFPRLAHADSQARAEYRLLGDGEGIHWPSIDEDISVIGLLAGRASAEYRGPGAEQPVIADQ